MIENKEINRTFDKYPEYKYSGEYWMGDVPKHWDIKKLKHVFQEKKKVTNPNLNCGSISFGKVVYKDDDKIPESTKASYQEVLDGEFLINPLNLNYDLISLRIGLSDINVVVSSGYLVLKNVIKLNKFYFNYLLHRYDVAYMKLLGSGVRQTINFNHIANSMLAFPPLTEQTSIANFLDDKTSKIDTAIAQKEQMIALLKERKQIIIQNAVTGKWSMINGEWGKTPKEKMKDSGVEWLGEIPEHWKLSKIKYVVKEHSGCGFPLNRQGLDCNEVPFYKVSDINGNEKFVKSSNNYVDWDTIKREKWNIVPKHSIVAGKIGEALRKNHRKITLTDSIIDNNCIAIEATNIDYNFNYYLQLIIDFDWFSNPGAVPSMSILKYKNFIIPIPSPREQTTIATFLDNKTSKIDRAITLQQTQIEKLKEYKATLIDSAVTGKIKING